MKYLIEVLFIQLLFLGIYELFLKKETFFQWNRFFLILAFASSFLLPSLELPELKREVEVPAQTLVPEFVWHELDSIELDSSYENLATESTLTIWHWIYFGGVFITLVLLLIKLRKLLLLRASGKRIKYKEFELIQLSESGEAFSFFRWIFMGDRITEEQKEHILKHERAHIQQGHSLDLFLFELLRIVFWFNPLVYLYQKKLSEVHEFSADLVCAKENKDLAYMNLLSIIFGVQHLSLVNQFAASSLLRRRIAMLKRKPSSRKQLLRFACIFPLLLAVLSYTSCEMVRASQERDSIENTPMDQGLSPADESSHSEKDSDLSSEKNKARQRATEVQPSDSIWNQSKEKRATSLMEKYEQLHSEMNRLLQVSNENNPIIQNLALQMEELYKEVLSLAVVKKKTTGEDDLLKALKDFDQQNKGLILNNLDPSDFTPPIYPGCVGAVDKMLCFQQKLKEHIQTNLIYPKKAKEQGKEGRVNVLFGIDKTGSVVDIRVQTDDEEFEKEARRLISKLERFTPAFKNGKAVQFPMAVPLEFKLSDFTDWDEKRKEQNRAISKDSLSKRLKGYLKEYLSLTKTRDQLVRDLSEDHEKVISLDKKLKLLYKSLISNLQSLDAKGDRALISAIKAIPIPVASRPKSLKNQLSKTVLPIFLDEDLVFPGCEQAEDKMKCFQEKFSEHFNRHHQYPKRAQEEGVEARVTTFFIVDKKGQITQLKIRSPRPDFDEEVRRVFNTLPSLVPGKVDGKAVDVPFAIPIDFKLPDSKKTLQNQGYSYGIVDVKPLFPGCTEGDEACFKNGVLTHIKNNFKYPEEAQKLGIEGKVQVQFTIDGRGEVTHVRSVGPHPLLEKESERIISSLPDMIPGKHDNELVDVEYSVPIFFKLR